MSWEPDIARALKDNATVRRVARRVKAWVGHPVIEHHKWYFLALGVLILVAIPWGLRAEEHALEDASVQALGDAGVGFADISFNGRTAVVHAPATSTDAITGTLSAVTGVRKVTVRPTDLTSSSDGADDDTAMTPFSSTTTTKTPTTESVSPRASLVIEIGGTVVVSGTLTDAITAATLDRSATFLYGGLVDNHLLVDSTLTEPVWLEAADDVLRLAPWLSRGEIRLEGNRVSIAGVAADEALAVAIVTTLQATVGADVPVQHDVTGPDGQPPSFEIVATADTVEVRGTLPDQRTRDRIVTSVGAVRDDASVANELVVGQGTPQTYLTMRTPYMVRLLGAADDFAYRYEGTDVRGAVVGTAFFKKSNDETTRATNLLIDALAAMMLADPDLLATIEIHSASADGDEANLELSRQRAQMTLLELVRAGIDPSRIQVSPGDGTGELLRFTLTSAENK